MLFKASNIMKKNQSLDYKTPADVYFEQERKALGYVNGL